MSYLTAVTVVHTHASSLLERLLAPAPCWCCCNNNNETIQEPLTAHWMLSGGTHMSLRVLPIRSLLIDFGALSTYLDIAAATSLLLMAARCPRDFKFH